MILPGNHAKNIIIPTLFFYEFNNILVSMTTKFTMTDGHNGHIRYSVLSKETEVNNK